MSVISRKKSGFTLVEMIIYIAIVSIILVSISYLMIDIFSGRADTSARFEVNDNLRILVADLDASIHQASEIKSVSTDSLTLGMPNSSDDVVFNFNSNNLTLTKQVGSGPIVTLQTNQVDVDGSFSLIAFNGRGPGVNIDLSIIYKNSDNLNDYNASTTINFFVRPYGSR